MLLHKTSQCKENLAKHIDKLTWQCYSVLDKKTWHQERIPVMEKDQILEKSRKENKNQDIYEKEIVEDIIRTRIPEILKEGRNIGAATAGILATVFFVIQILTGGGINYGLYAVVFSIPAAAFTVKAFRMKKKHEIFMAVIYIIFVLLLSASHIYNLVTSQAVR